MPYETNLIFKLDKDDAYIVSGYFYVPSNNGKEPANWKAKEKEMLDGMEKRYRADFLKGCANGRNTKCRTKAASA